MYEIIPNTQDIERAKKGGGNIKAIKDIDKLFRRGVAIAQRYHTEEYEVERQARTLGVTMDDERMIEYKRVVKKIWDDYFAEIERKQGVRQDEKMGEAERILKQIQKLNRDATISRRCPYPYEGNENLYIRLGYMEDAPGGWDPNPEYLMNYSRKYLGRTLSKIVTVARRFGVDVLKYSHEFYVKIETEGIRNM